AIRRKVQDRRGEGMGLSSLALVAEQRGELDLAEALHRESLAIGIEVQTGQDIADTYVHLGEFLITRRDQREEGCMMLKEAARLYEKMGMLAADDVRERARHLGCGQAGTKSLPGSG